MTTDIAAPTREQLVARARELRPLLERNATPSEQNRRLEDETVSALLDSGLLRLLVPKRFGGLEMDFRTALDVSTEVARGDGSVVG